MQPPNARHWLGTNALGQDLLAQILRGMQKSMLIGVCVAVISTGIAATVGSIAGYFGGWRDRALMWLVDLLLVVPSFILIAIVTPRTKSSANILMLVLLLAGFGWMISSRMVRGMTMSLREREFIRAARYMGVSSRRIILGHVVPNVASILIIDAALNVASAILAETGLSFLGFGIQPPDVSLGTLIADGTQSATTFPWVFLFPAGSAGADPGVRQPHRRRPARRARPRQRHVARWRPMSALLEVTDLAVTFPTDGQPVTAVRGIELPHRPRAKSWRWSANRARASRLSAMAVVGLLPEYARGVAARCGCTATSCSGLADDAMSRFRGKAVGMVFQDPMSALTPVYTVGDQIAEAIEVHQPRVGKKAARQRAVELLELVGIAQPERRARAFPHELSGGERQRVVIAIAIANDPDLLICDEPTTALDVTVQAQILEVLKTARDVTGAGVLIITHDLGVVAEFADRALVMYAGRVVEIRRSRTTFTAIAGCPTPSGCWARFRGWTPRRAPGWCPYPARRPSLVGSGTGLPVRAALPPGHRRMPRRRTGVAPGRRRPPGGLHPHRPGRRAHRRRYLRESTPKPHTVGIRRPPPVVRVRDLVKTYPLTKGVSVAPQGR